MNKRAHYNDTLIYTKNEKIYNKSMSLSDNDNNYVVEDEITRTKEWRNERFKKIKQFKDLGADDDFIEMLKNSYEESLTMTYSQCMERDRLEYEEDYRLRKEEYLKEHSPKKEVINLILDKFDKWFEKYKDSEEHMGDFHHRFEDPWFWGHIAPYSEDTEFYEHILTPEEQEFELYEQVFHYCISVVNDQRKLINGIGKNKNE